MGKFSDFAIDEWLLENMRRIGFLNPTEVQEKSIPIILEGHDIVVRAKTGTGKTGAYMVPVLQKIKGKKGGVLMLVILPTRELSLQVYHFGRQLARGTDIRVGVVYGGVSINPQIERLHEGIDVLVGTPGRLLDLINRGELDLSKVEYLVLDEADIMLDMGFIDDIEQIISKTEKERRHTLLFSATMPNEIVKIADRYMRNKVRLSIGSEEDITAEHIKHLYCISSSSFKFSTLLAYLKKYSPKKTIIFTATQGRTENIYSILKHTGYKPLILHGGLTQAKREHQIGEFREERGDILIATNVAARGIDIKEVTDIINFDAPDDPKVYVHRVGRSARMGREGRAFTIFEYQQMHMVGVIERIAGVHLEKIKLDTKEFDRIDFGRIV
ncbi:MAG: DEAD/DEAH box helicase, partial [Candidatus Micrarchaeaceae archaeon]